MEPSPPLGDAGGGEGRLEEEVVVWGAGEGQHHLVLLVSPSQVVEEGD